MKPTVVNVHETDLVNFCWFSVFLDYNQDDKKAILCRGLWIVGQITTPNSWLFCSSPSFFFHNPFLFWKGGSISKLKPSVAPCVINRLWKWLNSQIRGKVPDFLHRSPAGSSSQPISTYITLRDSWGGIFGLVLEDEQSHCTIEKWYLKAFCCFLQLLGSHFGRRIVKGGTLQRRTWEIYLKKGLMDKQAEKNSHML